MSASNNTESFPKLFGQLIKIYQDTSVPTPIENEKERKLKKHLYNVIYSHRQDKIQNEEALSELDKLVWYSHLLKRKRKFDDANKLDIHMKSIKREAYLQDSSVRNVLIFLTHLIDNEAEESKSGLSIPSPWVSSNYEDPPILPNQPLCYNDTRLDSAFHRWHYTHFPSHLFHMDESVLHSTAKKPLFWHEETFQACNKEPGLNHHFGFFRKDKSEIDTSCFGALVGPKRLKSPITPDTPLGIPNLPNIPDGYSFIHFLSYRNRLNIKQDENTVDEGYVSSRCSDAGNSLPKKDIWEEVLKEGFSPEKFTWENVIRGAETIKEKPFATESGSQVTHRLWTIEQNYVSTIDSMSPLPNCYELSPKDFCTHLLHMLSGIPSSIFGICKEENSFVVAEGLYYEGVTAESLQPHLEEFIECGNKVLRLEELCSLSYSEDGMERSGSLSMTSFERAIKTFLMYYRQKILSLVGDNKFIGIKLKTEALRKKVDFVYKVCLRGFAKDWFSNSLSLIGGLSKELLVTRPSNELFLLLYIFKSACKPFLVFLEKWIYKGEFCDPNSEYMIQIQDEASSVKTRTYWMEAYTLRTSFIELLPEFLRGVLVASFKCGKALNLLQICCPQNALFGKEASSKHPRVSLCNSLNEVLCKRLECQKYACEMRDLCSKSIFTLSDYDRQMEEKKKLLKNVAQSRRTERLHTFQERKKSRLLQEAEEKRKVLEMIKEDVKNFEFWKTKKKKEESKTEEKVLLERKIIEEERKLEEYKERISLLDYYSEEMGNLKSMEVNLGMQLTFLRRDLSNLQRVNADNDEEGEDTSRSESDNRNIPDNDYDSVSQMSTTPDPVETPNPDSSYNEEFPNIRPHKDNFPDPDNGATDPVNGAGLSNNNNNSSSGYPMTKQSIPNVLDNSVLAVSLEACSTEDTLNCNPQTTIVRTTTEQDHSPEENANTITTEILDTIQMLNFSAHQNKNTKFDKVLEGNETTSSENKPFERKEVLQEIKTKIYEEKEEMEDRREEEKKEDTVNVGEEEKNTEKIRMRKSKSESCSLKDTDFCMKNKKEESRFSLYDFNEVPVLIDKVCENEEQAEEAGPAVTFLDEELRQCISDTVTSSVRSYSKPLLNERKTGMDVASFSLPRDQGKRHESLEDVEEFDKSIPSNHLSFSPIYIVRGLSEHLEVQSKLVNNALLSHILVERKLLDHFLALKSFLLLNDAAFARTLIQNLIYRFPPGRPSPSFVSPVELNGILNETISASSSFQSPFACNLFFVVTELSSNSFSNPLDVIDLRYNVHWPLCIVLDDNVLSMYSIVSKFLVRLHEVMLTIEDSFRYMTAMRSRLEGRMGLHFHQINLFRHEIQQLVRVLFGYITHQAVEGSWNSFQRILRENVSSLDELYEAHFRFIEEVTDKCFLGPSSACTRNVMEDMFTEAVLFYNVLINSTWTDDLQNSKFNFLQQRICKFRDLYTLLNNNLLNLLQLTQQVHIEDLVLHLNFNESFPYS